MVTFINNKAPFSMTFGYMSKSGSKKTRPYDQIVILVFSLMHRT